MVALWVGKMESRMVEKRALQRAETKVARKAATMAVLWVEPWGVKRAVMKAALLVVSWAVKRVEHSADAKAARMVVQMAASMVG